jgi:hypothetical protein
MFYRCCYIPPSLIFFFFFRFGFRHSILKLLFGVWSLFDLSRKIYSPYFFFNVI